MHVQNLVWIIWGAYFFLILLCLLVCKFVCALVVVVYIARVQNERMACIHFRKRWRQTTSLSCGKMQNSQHSAGHSYLLPYALVHCCCVEHDEKDVGEEFRQYFGGEWCNASNEKNVFSALF